MATRVPSPAPRPDPRPKPPTTRLELHRFQSWQRWVPPPTGALVQLVRLLAR